MCVHSLIDEVLFLQRVTLIFGALADHEDAVRHISSADELVAQSRLPYSHFVKLQENVLMVCACRCFCCCFASRVTTCGVLFCLFCAYRAGWASFTTST